MPRPIGTLAERRQQHCGGTHNSGSSVSLHRRVRLLAYPRFTATALREGSTCPALEAVRTTLADLPEALSVKQS